jgi:hypothetical protein
VFIFIFYPLKQSIAFNRQFSLPDTRQICTQWILKHIPSGKFAQDSYTFQPYPRHAYFIGEFQFENYSIYQNFSIATRTLEEYRASGFTHLIVSSWLYDRYLMEADRYPQEVHFYRSLLSMDPLKIFEGVANEIAGPRIAIYAVH